jgi:hypothetical protein
VPEGVTFLLSLQGPLQEAVESKEIKEGCQEGAPRPDIVYGLGVNCVHGKEGSGYDSRPSHRTARVKREPRRKSLSYFCDDEEDQESCANMEKKVKEAEYRGIEPADKVI